jgi:hypothetical protein
MKAKLIGTLMTLIAGALPAMAAPCHQQVHHQKQVVAEVVYPVVQQINVVVPVYGLIAYPQVYAPPVAVQAHSDGDTIRELISEFKALRGELQALRAGPPAKVESPKLDTDAVVKALRTSCAQCHNQASADKDGGGLTLFKSDGSFAGVTPDMAKRIVRRVASGAMPPPPAKVEDAEKRLILDAFKQ